MALRRISFMGGRTGTSAALRQLRQVMFQSANGDREGVPNIVIIFTDGNSNIQEDRTIPEAIEDRIDVSWADPCHAFPSSV